MRVYLFANRVFGEAFLRTAAQQAREGGVPVTLVLSERRDPRVEPATGWRRLRKLAGRLRRRIRLRRELGLPALLAENVNRLRVGPGAHGVIAGFDQIFKRPLIEQFASLVNFHPSLLPLYRGPVPAYWCLRNGERQTGFSLHRVTEDIDAGEVLWQDTVPIDAGDDPEILTRRIAACAQPVFARYLAALHERRGFPVQRLDPAAVYRVHVDYASFP